MEALTRTATILKHDLDELQIDDWVDIFRIERLHPDDIVDVFNAGRRQWEWWPKPFDILPELRRLRDTRDKTRLITDEQAWAVPMPDDLKAWRNRKEKAKLDKFMGKVGKPIK